MFLRKFILAAALAVGALTAPMANAASCTVGTCVVVGADGQAISSDVLFDIDQIGAGAFTFSANFLNDQPQNGVTVAVGLTGLLGSVSNLSFNIIAPGSIAHSYALADNTPTKIKLIPTEGQIISFTLTGTSLAGLGGALPDINLFITAVPLPAGALLMGTALAGFGFMRRRRKAA